MYRPFREDRQGKTIKICKKMKIKKINLIDLGKFIIFHSF